MRELLGHQVRVNGLFRLAQFVSIPPVSLVAEGAEPVVAVGLADRCTGTHHFSSLASRVARSTHPVQPALRLRQVVTVRQGALPCGFPRPIHVENDPALALPIKQACLLRVFA